MQLFLITGGGAAALAFLVGLAFARSVFSLLLVAAGGAFIVMAYHAFAAPGDVTGDGKADWIARKPDGALYLYPGSGYGGTALFGSPIKIGTGYDKYNLWG